jgi:hypothetical protein
MTENRQNSPSASFAPNSQASPGTQLIGWPRWIADALYHVPEGEAPTVVDPKAADEAPVRHDPNISKLMGIPTRS